MCICKKYSLALIYEIVSTKHSLPVSLDADAIANGGALRGISNAVLSANGYASTRALKHIESVEYSVHEMLYAGNRPHNRYA